MNSLSEQIGYQRLLMSSLWIISFIGIVAMDCSDSFDVVTINQAGYHNSTIADTPTNGMLLPLFKRVITIIFDWYPVIMDLCL